MNKKYIIIMVLVAIVFGGGGFYGGMQYQKSKTPTRGISNFQGFQNGQRNGNASRTANGGFVTGQIISKDSSSITVKDRSGGSKIVFYSGSTNIGKTATGTPDDLTINADVIVSGAANSDGSITAQNINLSPLAQGSLRPQGQ